MEELDTKPSLPEKKVEIRDEPESLEDKKSDKKKEETATRPSGLDPIKFIGPPLKDAPSFSETGKDVTENARIQELAFLSILNLISDEKERADFLKWAKLEGLKQAKDKKRDSQTLSSKIESKASSPRTSTLPKSHGKESARSSLFKRGAPAHPRIKARSRRTRS